MWGKNASGQLGMGNTESLDFPTVVPFFAEKKVPLQCFFCVLTRKLKVRAVACGGAQTLVLTDQHELYQFGYDGFQSHRLPVLIEPAFAHSARKVASVRSHITGTLEGGINAV